jgi:hypothetical protein
MSVPAGGEIVTPVSVYGAILHYVLTVHKKKQNLLQSGRRNDLLDLI